MTHYVSLIVHGKAAELAVAEWVLGTGSDSIEYHRGGWVDDKMQRAHPHLKFDNEEDACAFILAHGGHLTDKMPLFGEIL